MLMRQMRQNTKIVMLAVAVAFVSLMVFEWGMNASGRSAGGSLGSIGGTTVRIEDYQTVYRSLYDQIQQSQETPISSQQNREIEDMAWTEVGNQILIQNELRRRGIRVSDDEIREAARQYVRKVTGFGRPAAHNEAAFEAAVEEIAKASKHVLRSLEVRGATVRSKAG